MIGTSNQNSVVANMTHEFVRAEDYSNSIRKKPTI